MIDFSKFDYECEGQMTFDECLKELERYKWDQGAYMNLPETEELHHENNGFHPGRKRKRNIKEKAL